VPSSKSRSVLEDRGTASASSLYSGSGGYTTNTAVTFSTIGHLQLIPLDPPEPACPRAHVPNAEIARVIGEALEGKNVVRSKDANEMFRKLGI
jgi:hypothetical protein